MRKLTRPICVLLLAAPLVAVADPVEIVTRTSGDMKTDSQIMEWLGFAGAPNGAHLPYELTLRTVIDPQAPTFDGKLGYWLTQNMDAQVEVTLALGALTYRYDGAGKVDVSGYQDTYRQHVTITLPGHPLGLLIFQNDAAVAGVDFGLHSPLNPPALSNAEAIFSAGSVSGVDDTTSNSQTYASSTGYSTAFSVSMVPEPAQGALLAAGLAMLILPGWKQKARYRPVRACRQWAALQCGRAMPAGARALPRLH
jgi:hypothetical protein